MTFKFLPVVTSKQMQEIEKKAFSSGVSEDRLIKEAGKKLFEKAIQILQEKKMTQILLLVGKGNNGADALYAGELFAKNDLPAEALLFFKEEELSSFSKESLKRFVNSGGKVLFLEDKPDFGKKKIVIDGLFGTGFKGNIEEPFASIIQKINDSLSYVLSADIPSGLNGNTGDGKNALIADQTVTFSLPKKGFFFNDGFDHAGNIQIEKIGLEDFYQEIETEYRLLHQVCFSSLFKRKKRTAHKYERGFVAALAGSEGMMGAAKLSCLSALKAGAGIVKNHLLQKREITEAYPLEIIDLYFSSIDQMEKSLLKADALLIGPGLSRSKEVFSLLKELFPKFTLPLVIDADALYFLAKHPDMQIPQDAVLTPHRKEMLRLLQKETFQEDFFEDCKKYAEKKKIHCIVKGAPSFIFSYLHPPVILSSGSPSMATAGTGDVLTGMIASFLSQKISPYEALLSAAFAHGKIGETAAEEKSFSMIASDMIEFMPKFFIKVF